MRGADRSTKPAAALPDGPCTSLQADAVNGPAAAEHLLEAMPTAHARSDATEKELRVPPEALLRADGDLVASAEPQHRKVTDRPPAMPASRSCGSIGMNVSAAADSESSLPRTAGPASSMTSSSSRPTDQTSAALRVGSATMLGTEADHDLQPNGYPQQFMRASIAEHLTALDGVSRPGASDGEDRHQRCAAASLGSRHLTTDERAALTALDDQPPSPHARLNGSLPPAGISLKSPSLHEASP